jgi:triphosphatase
MRAATGGPLAAGLRDSQFKLELTPEELQRTHAHTLLAGLTVGEPVTKTLHSIYFDTPDGRLRGAGVCLRIRADGASWVQTVRAENATANGLSHPVELMVNHAEPDLGVIDDIKLQRKLARLTRGSVLEPAFETMVKRTTHHLRTERGDLELTLDEGVVRSGKVEKAICEAELELKSGSTADLLETATKLFANEPVRLVKVSTAERGYDLIFGRSDASPRPQSAQPVVVRKGATCRDALPLFVESASRQILTNRQAVLETDDPEGVHQLRIGLRRLRSALYAFRPLIDVHSTREMDLHAKAVGRAVSALRDADMFIDDIYAPAAGSMKGHPGLRPLKQALQAHRALKRDAARSELEGKHWSALQLYLALWPQTIVECHALDRPVAKFGRDALGACWRKALKKGKHLAKLEGEQRHKMRKTLKTLRYTAEFFGSLYDASDVQPFIKQLKRLQDLFGYINDVETAVKIESICDRYARDSREGQRAAGYTLGWHTARAAVGWGRAEKRWHDLQATGRFWR